MNRVRRRHAIHRARELAHLGRVDEAVDVMPGPDELQPADFDEWAEAERVLCEARPGRNTEKLGRTLRCFFETLRSNGSLHRQGVVAAGAAHLALERGDTDDATRNIADLAAVLPRLRRPGALAAEHAALAARLDLLTGAKR
jgi:hypothetical protein